MRQPPPPSEPELYQADPRGRVPVQDVTHPASFQRLVANPFLAFAGLTLWAGLVRWSTFQRHPGPFLGVLATLVLVPPLWHYHCRDCGGTGLLWRWRGHACDRVLARQTAGRPRRFRGPTPPVQTALWVVVALVLAGVAVLARI